LRRATSALVYHELRRFPGHRPGHEKMPSFEH
jgi:hypothetical protein